MKTIEVSMSEFYKSTELEENPILKFCKQSKSIAQISKRFNIKRSTLAYYLNILKKQGVITIRRIEKKKTGRPTLIKANFKKIEEIKKENQESAKNIGDYNPIEYEVLQILKQKKGKALSEYEIENAIANMQSFEKPPYYTGISQENWDKMDDQDKAESITDTDAFGFLMRVRTSFSPYIDVKFVIKEEGEKYLKKHKDKHIKTIESKK